MSKLTSAGSVGKGSNDSKGKVRRYIRLTNLTPELLELVDDEFIHDTSGKCLECGKPTRFMKDIENTRDFSHGMNRHIC